MLIEQRVYIWSDMTQSIFIQGHYLSLLIYTLIVMHLLFIDLFYD